MFAEGAVVGASDDVDQLPQSRIAASALLPFSILGSLVVALALMLLRNGIERPIGGLQPVPIVIPLKISADVFIDPYLLEHGMQFLLDIDIILEAQLHLLLALQHLLVLVLEEDGAEIVEFWHYGDQLLVVAQLDPLEEVGQDVVVVLEQLGVGCWVEGQVQRQLALLDAEDVVDEGVYVLLLDEVARGESLQLRLEDCDHPPGLPQCCFLYSCPHAGQLLLVLHQQIEPLHPHEVPVLVV